MTERLTDEQKKLHLMEIYNALDSELQSKTTVRRILHIRDVCTVEVKQRYYSVPPHITVKFRFDYRLRSKTWRQHKSGKFSYKRIAKDIRIKYDEYLQKVARRDRGEQIAQKRAEELKSRFQLDPMLSATNVWFDAESAYQTETGDVDISLGDSSSDDSEQFSARLKFDGNSFDGRIDFSNINAEQLVAVVVALRAEQLNALEMLSLADDSILGPVIRRLVDASETGEH